jgi:hypothetical protein
MQSIQADAGRAIFVFLDLLKAHTQGLTHFGLAFSSCLAADTQSSTELFIDIVIRLRSGTSLRHSIFPYGMRYKIL